MTRRADPLAVFNRIASEVWLTGPDAFVHVRQAALPESLSARSEERNAEEEGNEAFHSSVLLPRLNLPDGLSHFLYAQYYLEDPNEVENGRKHALSKIPIRAREDPAFGRALRMANHGRGYSDPGWVVAGHLNGSTLARKNGITLFLSEADIVRPPGPATGSTPLETGAPIAVRFPNDRPYASPGFYTAEGDGGPATPEGGRQIIRIYFAVGSGHAAALLSALTRTLGARLSRFSFKLLNNPRWYTRPDAAVAYVLRDEYPLTHRILRDVFLEVRDGLIDTTPALAFPIARGIAVADEPPAEPAIGRRSFGFHRSELIASGLARAYAVKANTPGGRTGWILREFRAAGLDPMRPWLNAGSQDFIPLDVDDDAPLADSSRGASGLSMETFT
jgi:hypothetical protein